jgi:teichoic acid transport system ATP-binding protein
MSIKSSKRYSDGEMTKADAGQALSLVDQFADPPGREPSEQNAYIEAKKVGIKYEIGSKREDIQSRAFGLLKKTRARKEIWALKDVSFTVRAGVILGLIGLNGAGKTTLCRAICGLLRPDRGTMQVNGSVSALLSLGAGFNSSLSGRQNIYLNAMMLGFSKKAVDDMADEIVEFADLGIYIDEPLKNYSNGMRSRLGFSIASMIEPEILIVDETLSAGDLEFFHKAGKKLQNLISKSRIVVVVTHQIGFVENYCTHAIWLHQGTIKAEGHPAEVALTYRNEVPRSPRRTTEITLEDSCKREGKAGVVQAQNLGIQFVLSANGASPEARWRAPGRGLFRKSKIFWALRDLNFSVNEGEIVGLIGRNGAGKTTLCKIICGILKPDEGRISVDGKLTALLTLGAGFNIQLTGKDNIFLNGMMLGMSKKLIKNLYADIVDFSELGGVIEQPVKTYSSGLRSRLGFSIAAMIRPDIFIVDEVLNVGDIAFYEKSAAKIQELMLCSKAVIVVSHNLKFIEKVCTRGLWIDQGIVRFDGNSKAAVESYRSGL